MGRDRGQPSTFQEIQGDEVLTGGSHDEGPKPLAGDEHGAVELRKEANNRRIDLLVSWEPEGCGVKQSLPLHG